MDKVEEYISKEVVEGSAAHIKMELTSQISPVTLKIKSGLHSQTMQVKVSLRNPYSKSYWKLKSGAPPYLEVLESTKIAG